MRKRCAIRTTRRGASAEHALHIQSRMQVSLDQDQAEILRELLTSAVTQLRMESSHTDTRAFRERLHERERIVEAILGKLVPEPRAPLG